MRRSHDEHFQADGVRGQSARSGLVCVVVVCLFREMWRRNVCDGNRRGRTKKRLSDPLQLGGVGGFANALHINRGTLSSSFKTYTMISSLF